MFSNANPNVQTKLPRSIFDKVFAFPPNRETLGGTAYLILRTSESQTSWQNQTESRATALPSGDHACVPECGDNHAISSTSSGDSSGTSSAHIAVSAPVQYKDVPPPSAGEHFDVLNCRENGTSSGDSSGNILIDCPAWNDTNRDFLHDRGGVAWVFLTHRGAMSQVRQIQDTFHCQVVVQEQEAYLLPDVNVRPFRDRWQLSPELYGLWMCGHSPGSACLYWAAHGGILFSGRHLLPNAQGDPVPLRTSKTFHWPRQLRNLQFLVDRFSPETLHYICPGANLGLLRDKVWIDQAYDRLSRLDLAKLAQIQPFEVKG